jgi:hypothetical protein
VSGSYSDTWTQSDVTTVDKTDITKNIAAWEDDFTTNWVIDPPPSVKGLITTYQAAIFTVPAGTANIGVLINDASAFQHNYETKPKQDFMQISLGSLVSPPSLTVSPQSLTVLPGQVATVNISANILDR